MDEEYVEIVGYDDEEDDDRRNARSGRARGRGRYRRPARRAVVVRPAQRYSAPPAARSPIVHKYGGLKWGLIADAGAKALAAVQPLPGAPRMGSDATKNLQNLADYHEALAQHAKRSQQLTTLGSIAKVFLT